MDAELAVVGGLLQIPPHRRHFRLYRGLIAPTGLPEGAAFERLVSGIMAGATVASFDAARYRSLLEANRHFVVVVDGMTGRQTKFVHERLKEHETYVGALGLDDRVGKHWALYQLPAVYRIIGEELRVQHLFDALDDDPEYWEGRVEHWRRRHMFQSVALENVSVQSTVFDEYDTPIHAARRAEVGELLEDQLGDVGNDLLIRLWDLDPLLSDVLHAALTTLQVAETSEHRAQVALSLRRLLERLANSLYPPTSQVREGRKLGVAEYRNRLWAYVSDHAAGSHRRAVLSNLEDVGARIDRLHDLANAGLHSAPGATELHRLFVAIISLLYDMLLLAAPPVSVPDAPYGTGIIRGIRELLGGVEE